VGGLHDIAFRQQLTNISQSVERWVGGAYSISHEVLRAAKLAVLKSEHAISSEGYGGDFQTWNREFLSIIAANVGQSMRNIDSNVPEMSAITEKIEREFGHLVNLGWESEPQLVATIRLAKFRCP
jgi:hypothetical protein